MPCFTPTELHTSTQGKCPNFHCWLPSSSISATGGVAPSSKTSQKLELRKGESLLIHVCCVHNFPADPETKPGNSDSRLIPSFLSYCRPLTVFSAWLREVVPFPFSSKFDPFLIAQVAELESDVRHLNHMVRGHQEDARQLSVKIRDIEHRDNQKEKEQQELRDRLHVSEQQVSKNSLLSSLVHTPTGEIYRRLQ